MPLATRSSKTAQVKGIQGGLGQLTRAPVPIGLLHSSGVSPEQKDEGFLVDPADRIALVIHQSRGGEEARRWRDPS